MKMLRAGSIWVVGLILAVAGSSYAAPVTVNLTGVVTYVGGNVTIPSGAAVTGSYTYDDAAAGTVYSYPTETDVVYPVTNFTLTFGDTAFPAGSTIGPWTGQLILVEVPSSTYYAYQVSLDNFGAPATGSLSGAQIPGGGIDVYGVTPAGFPAIPDPANVLSLFPVQDSDVQYQMNMGDTYDIMFDVLTLSAAGSPATVPVPGAGVLGLLGFAGAAWLRRRKMV